MNFPKPLELCATDLRADAGWIARWTLQAKTNAWRCARVVEQPHGRAVLADAQIHTAIAVKVRHRRATLFAVNSHTTFRSRQRAEATVTIAAQPEAATAIVTA